jgi:hypothetical protein
MTKMSAINRALHAQKVFTHEGARAVKISSEELLRRSVLSCLLWEKEFYEDGEDIAKRISETAAKCSKEFVSALAIEARKVHGLRHVPLLLLLDLVKKGGPGVKHTIAEVISRPDEMMELVAMYWMGKPKKDGKIPAKMSDRQLRDGLALAFGKFSEYSLAKYNRDTEVKLRDVLFLSHPKPKDDAQAALFKRVANNELAVPDTWEVELSAGKDKRQTFERLIKEGKLGYLALLRNLRNMVQCGCDLDLVRDAIKARKGADLVFPFRYVAAARYAPALEGALDEALQETIKTSKPLPGRTLVYVDVSGSMDRVLSAKSDLTRIDAACTLASIINAEDLRVFSFSYKTVEVPARRGMAGVDAIKRSQPHGGTELFEAIRHSHSIPHDRVIFITDEQAAHDAGRMPKPACARPYMINVASYRNGIGYRDWIHLDGFSEAVIRYIHCIEEMK